MLISRVHVTSCVFYRPEITNLLTNSKIMKNSLFWLCNCFADFSWSSGGVLKVSSWSNVTEALFQTCRFLQYVGALMTPSVNFWNTITSGGMVEISWNLVCESSWNRCMHVSNFVALPCVNGGCTQEGLYTPHTICESICIYNPFEILNVCSYAC